MRILHIFAAISGAMATGLLVASAHPLRDHVGEEAIWYVILGATLQLGSAIAALVVVQIASGRLAALASSLLVLGSAAFSGVLLAITAFKITSFNVLAPLGGLVAMFGWLLLALVRPRQV
jgi:uncharacterized membrane protein YgdD (TMEM256/DUF423 family)